MADPLAMLEGSVVFMIVGYIIALGFQLYMLFLNWKQSRVNNQMDELVSEVRQVRKLLEQQQKTTPSHSPTKKKK